MKGITNNSRRGSNASHMSGLKSLKNLANLEVYSESSLSDDQE